MCERSVEQLREEILQIDTDLAQLSAQERDAERGIDALALQARRGNGEAERQIGEHEKCRASAQNNRRRLKAARASIESEIQMALAGAERKAVKEKAREAKKIIAQLRNRGVDVDTIIRNLIDEYNSIAADVVALAALGASQIKLRLVQLGCERALRAKLASIKDLELRPVAPLERREFASLTNTWTVGAERWINSILNEPAEEPTATVGPAVKQALTGR
jgi:hypothetical protein